MTPQSDGAALLRRIHETPEDRLLPLVFADWLDENGDSTWAAYLRLCRDNSTPRGPEAAALTRKLTRRWKKEYGFGKSTKFVYLNGFIDHVKTPYANFDRVVELARTHPVLSVNFTEYRPGRNGGGWFFELVPNGQFGPGYLPQEYLSGLEYEDDAAIAMSAGGLRDYLVFDRRSDAIVSLCEMFGRMVNDLALDTEESDAVP